MEQNARSFVIYYSSLQFYKKLYSRNARITFPLTVRRTSFSLSLSSVVAIVTAGAAVVTDGCESSKESLAVRFFELTFIRASLDTSLNMKRRLSCKLFKRKLLIVTTHVFANFYGYSNIVLNEGNSVCFFSVKCSDKGGFMVRTDKRREQSKSAARSRRRVEAEVFVDLAEVLPFNQSERTVYQVDRIAVLRLAVTYYKLRRLANCRKLCYKNNCAL